MQPGSQQFVTYAVTGAIVALVLLFRLRRMRRVQPLKLERLWIVPALLLGVLLLTFGTKPPAAWVWVASAAALMIGAGLGWWRGKMMRIEVDPESHALNQTGSPAAMVFILLFVLLRQGARYEAGALGFDAAAVADVLLALAAGLFTAQRVEMYLRGRRLLATARAG